MDILDPETYFDSLSIKIQVDKQYMKFLYHPELPRPKPNRRISTSKSKSCQLRPSCTTFNIPKETNAGITQPNP